METPRAASQTWLFMVVACFMLAHQIAGKALRDGIFLSQFPSSDLPKIAGAAALVAIGIGFGATRLMSSFNPVRVVSGAFASGAILHLIEYFCLRSGGDALRSAVAAVIYLHVVALGAAVMSGFWSIAGEAYTPQEAREHFGRIAGFGTLGGIAGGVVAERCTALLDVDTLLLPLACFHFVCAIVILRVHPIAGLRIQTEDSTSVWSSAKEALANAPFLRNLAVLVLTGTISAMLLDFLFKTEVAREFGKGPSLTRYFATFYATNQFLSFLAQTYLAPSALRRFGLGRTVMCHPLAIALGAGASLFAPVFIMMPVARGLELVLRGSLFRSGYEIFFTPIPPHEKRAVKTFIDVSCDRLGDALGAAVIQLLLLFGPQEAMMPILAVTISLALLGIWITLRMDTAYASVLEHGLLTRAIAIHADDAQDSTTLSAIWHSHALLPQVHESDPLLKSTAEPPPAPPTTRLDALRSRDSESVQSALRPDLPFDPLLVPQVIRLLAWNDVTDWARAFLSLHAHLVTGQLSDSLLNPDEDAAIRRRIPRILAHSNSQRAVHGLTLALADPSFEVRFNVSRALDYLRQLNPELQFDTDVILATVERELSVSRSIWSDRRLLDRRDTMDSQFAYLDEVLEERANRSLEHVFSLLALLLPREPLKVAFRALHSEDRLLRGLSLEYLETNLTRGAFQHLTELVDGPPASAASPEPSAALEALMATQFNVLQSIRIPSGGAAVPGVIPPTTTAE